MLVASPKTQQYPQLTTALVVCRESLHKHNVESLPHVVTLVDEYLNPFSSRKKVGRACRLGLPRRALEYAAARDPDWDNGQYMAAAAVIRGFVHVLQWLNECYPERTSWGDGHEGLSRCGRFLMDTASEHGHLPVMQWLHANRSEGCTYRAMNYAAASGRLDMAQWIHENRSGPCSTEAMDYAAGKGHLDVVRFLHENRTEGCTKHAMSSAAANGHLEMVQWLYANRNERMTANALRSAAKYGHLNVVQWLSEIVWKEPRGEACIQDAARIALQAGHIEVTQHLEQILKGLSK
ncbi:hypothetical protein Pcac1_g9936 [Phytophthora cactorum]|uniref:Uncharacterized protein n=1 Tax=Phytophthora cactorum TaxID=29920 RepID=A0A329SGP7_9STRA|nr:hypothetical protein Pcac1_g9936 [Phytophthora cactorum]KAG2955527.1 hypothetical protein PC117_g324 [Phytophthora cactorum]KAG3013196.1 hypothetical protein PC120_g13418 [Phytophthora cactorum]KAG3103333.1 hypothetical protein PC121_g985 [Phytophthora cactorum]RAW35860.1 hypothetical protein PC110_g7836 [Phytophthora cactorum]